MKPIKVLQVGMTGNIGGMETYLMEQYRHLDRKKIQYDFVNITENSLMVYSDEILNNGDNIFSVCRRSVNPLKHYWGWFKLLVQHKGEYDGIVLNACHLYYVFPMVLGRFMGIPHRIIHSHNNGDEIAIGLFRKCLIGINRQLLYWGASDYWACSDLAGKWMFREKRFQVIHNAIDINKFSFNSDIRQQKRHELGIENKFVIGHVGRFSYQKNHEFLINIFNKIYKTEKNAILLLVGDVVEDDCYFKQTKHRVNELGLQDNVLFLGLRTDVSEIVQAMDCFVLPSYFEGLPLVGLEAQAAGLPCFVSEVITRELAITPLIQYISLNDGSEIWAKKILQMKNTHRRNMSSQIEAAGYNICNEVRKIEDFYSIMESKAGI